MHNAPESIDDVYVEIVNDDQTPFDFVSWWHCENFR